jgi:hypothetical protein
MSWPDCDPRCWCQRPGWAEYQRLLRQTLGETFRRIEAEDARLAEILRQCAEHGCLWTTEPTLGLTERCSRCHKWRWRDEPERLQIG